jgi:hypothetical protein
MALNTYSALKTSIANYLGRSDLTSQIPDFISLAETRMARELRIRQMLNTVTTATTAADPTVGLPADFLEIRDLFLNSNPRTKLQYVSPSSFSADIRTSYAGSPLIYTMRGLEFEFAPVPDAAYVLQMLYYARPEPLSDTNQVNTFLSVAPDALLYGSLAEAEPYLMNDSRIQTWATLYINAIDKITVSDDQGEFAGVPLIMSVR